jgi:hypothetical protein
MRWLWIVVAVVGAMLVLGGVVARVQAHNQEQRFLVWETCEFNHNPPTVCGPAPVP